MSEIDLESAIEKAYLEASEVVQFGRAQWDRASGKLRPRMHQLVRMHEMLNNNTSRMVCADTTSAGKTATATWIKGLLDEQKGEKTKTLLIGPNQALGSAWTTEEINTYTAALGLPKQKSMLIERGKFHQLKDQDFICVNYDKYSIPPKRGEVNDYTDAILSLLPQIDSVIIDECHNLKNINSNCFKAFKRVIEGTKDKKTLLLSASIIPNRLKDAGSMLYLFDPERYAHYADHAYDYQEDPFSLTNAMHSGAWFSFSREDLKNLFGLPDLLEGVPDLGIPASLSYELSKVQADLYFNIWKQETDGLQKISQLSTQLLEHSLDHLEEVVDAIIQHDKNSQFATFTFYTDGISSKIKERLERVVPGRVEMITGAVPLKDRLEIAKEFRNNKVQATVNTTSTVSESISLITYDRPAFVLFPEPPIVPATFDQSIGRLYRILQEAPVHFIEMIPESKYLEEIMVDEVEKQRADGIRYRRDWKPGNVFQNKQQLRMQKKEAIHRVEKAMPLGDLSSAAEVGEGSEDPIAYKSIPKERTISTNQQFNEGPKAVIFAIGKPVEDLLSSPSRIKLHDSYAAQNWDITMSADTNRAIAEIIHTLEEENKHILDPILDWGCGTACLARMLNRPIYNLDAMKEMVDTAKEITLELGLYDATNVNEHIILGNARAMPFEDEFFGVVSSSYALQYNAQGYQHKRDVEEILKETNRVLSPEGYGVLALVNQATSKEDVNVLKNELLPRYGFNVLYSDYISGHAINETTMRENKVLSGFYLLVFNKTLTVSELVGSEDQFLYSPYKTVGIGGTRTVAFEQKVTKGYKSKQLPSTIFRSSDKVLLTDAIKNSLGGLS